MRAHKRSAKRNGTSLIAPLSSGPRIHRGHPKPRKTMRNGCPARGWVSYCILSDESCALLGVRNGSFLLDMHLAVHHDANAIFGGLHVPLEEADLSRARTLQYIWDAFDNALRDGADFRGCCTAALFAGSSRSACVSDRRYYPTASRLRGHHRALWKKLLGMSGGADEGHLVKLLTDLQRAVGGFFALRYRVGHEVRRWCAGHGEACNEFMRDASDHWVLIVCVKSLGELANRMANGVTGLDVTFGISAADLAMATAVVRDNRRHVVSAFHVFCASEEAKVLAGALRVLRHVVPMVVNATVYHADDSPALFRAIRDAVPTARVALCLVHVAANMVAFVKVLGSNHGESRKEGSELYNALAALNDFRVARTRIAAQDACDRLHERLGAQHRVLLNWELMTAYAKNPALFSDDDMKVFDNADGLRVEEPGVADGAAGAPEVVDRADGLRVEEEPGVAGGAPVVVAKWKSVLLRYAWCALLGERAAHCLLWCAQHTVLCCTQSCSRARETF